MNAQPGVGDYPFRPVATAPKNKKVARAAKVGGSPSKRTTALASSFNLSVMAICVVGIALIAGSLIGRSRLESPPYAQTSKKHPDRLEAAQKAVQKIQAEKKPDAKALKAAQAELQKVVEETHWHSAYGIFNCDKFIPAINANAFKDELGIHAHDDGLIHIHPFYQRAAGKNATIGKFLDSVFLTITKDYIEYPTSADGSVKTKLETKKKCNGKAAEVYVLRWEDSKDTEPQRYTSDFRNIPLAKGGAFAFVIAAKGTKVPVPASISAVEAPADIEPAPAELEGTDFAKARAAAAQAGQAGTVTTVAPGAAVTTVAPAGTATTVAPSATSGAATSTVKPTPTTVSAATTTLK